MAPDTKVPDGRTERRTDGRTDNAKTISLRLWRGIIIHMVTVLDFQATQCHLFAKNMTYAPEVADNTAQNAQEHVLICRFICAYISVISILIFFAKRELKCQRTKKWTDGQGKMYL
ncbi:hypothetical protein DPMN_161205 [Dreissena polymorpha]|uniref:Uncharacterized protein n=1 Tax=Dreissena polymorpha TaxID=45954 RepID=A0A9D4EP89_DREPO|nr:hypothetical protein DPMN_161205 [Dreissena polymorpha]